MGGVYVGKLSFTMENYLEAIYELSREGTGARITDIAERLGVSKASTNSAMATLAEHTSNKHRVIKKFLCSVLDVSPSVAETDACAIEHVISNDSIAAMKEFMQKDKDKKK
jgi:Mn-dependent DtxR family transcriptional regulator